MAVSRDNRVVRAGRATSEGLSDCAAVVEETVLVGADAGQAAFVLTGSTCCSGFWRVYSHKSRSVHTAYNLDGVVSRGSCCQHGGSGDIGCIAV